MIGHEDCGELHFTKDIEEEELAGVTQLYYMTLMKRGLSQTPGCHGAESQLLLCPSSV